MVPSRVTLFFAVVVMLPVVFLPASVAALPNVGSCTFMEYYCDALKCNTLFYKRLQKDPKGDCSAKYHQLVDCLSKSMHICFVGELPESQIRRIVYQSFKESMLCFYGGLEIPAMPSVGSPCSASYSSDANVCLKTFHEKFAANKSDPSLCQEKAKAKKCLKKLIDSDCSFSSRDQELLDLDLGDYNPFCSNNRDPGATGKDQCDGVREPPNIGSCAYMEYHCDALKCNTLFYKRLQKDPKGDCSAKYNQLVGCVSKTIQICYNDGLPEIQIKGLVDTYYKENALCFYGGVEIPAMPSIGSPCPASFSSDANACVKTFQEKFAADKSDPSLCWEQAKAKKCLKKLIGSNCTLPSLFQEELDLRLGDYNPFCSNTRDPGATGKDQCDGVRDLGNPLNALNALSTRHPLHPLNAAADLKPSVLQALLFSFISLLFFVKI